MIIIIQYNLHVGPPLLSEHFQLATNHVKHYL